MGKVPNSHCYQNDLLIATVGVRKLVEGCYKQSKTWPSKNKCTILTHEIDGFGFKIHYKGAKLLCTKQMQSKI